jgi:hypothetical protein
LEDLFKAVGMFAPEQPVFWRIRETGLSRFRLRIATEGCPHYDAIDDMTSEEAK